MFQPAKVLQAERRTKRIHSFFIPKRRLSSPKAKIYFSYQMNKRPPSMQSVALFFWNCVTLFIINLSDNMLFL